MENCTNNNYQPIVECHNDYLEILKGEYSCGKEGVNIKKENWKKYLFVLQDVKGVYANFMIYKKSSKNWKSETPKYKFDLTDGKFEIKLFPVSQERFLFEIYIEEKDTRFLVSTKDEETRNLWVYRLMSTRIMDPFSNEGTVYLVKVLETLDIRKYFLTGVCYLHVFKDRLCLSRMSDRCLLAEWPLQIVRFYASSQDLLKLELGRKSMHGEMIIYFQTNRAKELFHLIKTAIHNCSGQFRDVPTGILNEEKTTPLVASAEYATVNLIKKAERRLQIEQTKSAMSLRKFYTPPPPPPPSVPPVDSGYELVSSNIEEIERHFQSPSVSSREVIPFEPFEDYDTLQHMRSAFGDSRSSSSQSDHSESDSTSNSGEYSSLRLSPKSPLHQLVKVYSLHDQTIDSTPYPDPEYSTIDAIKIPKSYSADLLATTEKEVVSNLWPRQSRGPAPPPQAKRFLPRKKTSTGVDENITNALESLTIPDNSCLGPMPDVPSRKFPANLGESEHCLGKKIHRRNGTRHRNATTNRFKPKCRTNIISYYEQPLEFPTPNSTKALAY